MESLFKKPKIEIRSSTEQGSIFNIVVRCSTALRKVGHQIKVPALRGDVWQAENYDAAIARIRQDINLIDLDGRI